MIEQDWRKIAKDKLSIETENRIRSDYEFVYDKAYGTLRELINQGIVSKWSDMKNILVSVNKRIINEFTKKFGRKQSAPG